MIRRTYIRILINDIFRNNLVIKIVSKVVNFYYKMWFKDVDNIKFSSNVPIKDMRERKTFSFQSVTGDTIDCK